jgi:SAM-dependent methyltransferase
MTRLAVRRRTAERLPGGALAPEAIARVYDRFGRLQDSQRFYEDGPVRLMVEQADLTHASAVFELGCGTGRVAQHLLKYVLPPDCTYVGVDVSPRMVDLSRERLRRWADRVTVSRVDGRLPLPADEGTVDRFLSTYVFDLLDPADAAATVQDAARIVVDGGLLALVSLAPADHGPRRWVSRAWTAVWDRWPGLVGGCRPLSLHGLIGPEWWITGELTTARWGLTSTVLVARRHRRNSGRQWSAARS